MASRRYFGTRMEQGVLVVSILQPVGSLSDDSILAELDSVLAELQANHANALIVDFCQTSYFGSSMLEALRIMWNKLHPANGRMTVCNLSPLGREILELSKFDQIWPIVDTTADALAILRARPEV